MLPNQLQEEDSKALGVGYEPESDKLRILASINFSKKRGKMRTGLDLREEEVRRSTPEPLSRRLLLGQIASLYDPIGLVTPAKQKGVILVRESFQEARKDRPVKDTWDDPLSPRLREAAVTLFEEYVRLGQIRFDRSLTPSEVLGSPVGITFSDGSEASYGAVLYLRWETEPGQVIVRLVESKAKLTPLDQKGDGIKAELCGAVIATRLKKYFERHCRIPVDHWVHLVDSQTILGAIQKDSYGYQTFFANRIGEIQKAGPVDTWKWVEGCFNIADILTRGATPEELDEDSEWQTGPQFLKWPESEWPVKTASEVSATVADETIKRLQRRAFSAVVTRHQEKKNDMKPPELGRPGTTPPVFIPIPRMQVVALVRFIGPGRFSSLTKLCGTVAWTRRAVEAWLGGNHQTTVNRNPKPSLTAVERAEAFRCLVLEAQDGAEIRDSTLDRLVVRTDEGTGLLLCGGRIQSWNEGKIAIPLVPMHTRLATLLALEAHEKNHEGVAATLLRTRERAWIIQGRRVVRKVINDCIHCRKQRARVCQQVMSDLPLERTQRAGPFEYTTLDLFGPYEVKDAVKGRVRKKVWGIIFCCMASRAVHADGPST
ncbi:uncharacterized protein LOC109523554 isoform X2 [Hippocampus comes]|uniref:uncharacterized protein LOC109523554 isoform X2 n=1 Tax=Hippocampus comes TaxID=109280 RepID=UPI00094EA261|nr:PREDICTED: uncharacterized protein LOC109523554 isoform X2 [Hippocampus comes]